MSTSDPERVIIRPLHDWSEYLAAEELQRSVWRMPDWRDAVPANLLITIQKNGGILLGAFDGDRLAGFAFSFVGIDRHLDPPLLKHCSHMLAVLPEYQSRHLGVQLKFRQRELALAQGIELMTWTYDPLLALNAKLNLTRLGAVARRYIPDAYGEMTDGLNAGLASDRFEVEWWLNSARARACAAGAPFTAGSETGMEWPYVRDAAEIDGDNFLVEIPDDLAALKAASPERAREWRSRTRAIFTRAFAVGYTATAFVTAPRPAYVLTRGPIETGKT